MNQKIIERIKASSRGREIFDFLAGDITLSDLQSFLLSVYRERAAQLSPSGVMQQYRENRFVRPSPFDPLKLMELNKLAFSLIPEGFKPIELSPLAPLGACSVLGPVSQNNVVSTVRNTEVAADSTNVLALECARMIRDSWVAGPAAEDRTVKLAACQRQVRAQKFDIPHAFAHFMMFALCTAGCDRGSFHFHLESLNEHIGFYIRFLKNLATVGMPVNRIRLVLFLLNPRLKDPVIQDICGSVSSFFPDVAIDVDPDGDRGEGYYKDLRFNIYATDDQKQEYFLADGGFTDWTQKLLQSKKERMLTSGIGIERICDCFG